jgi:hypothetical protein
MLSISYGLLLKEKSRIRSALKIILGSNDAADIALLGMRLQFKYGKCFASAAYLGRDIAISRYIKRHHVAPDPDEMNKIMHNAKILTLRIVSKMREAGFVTTERRIRPDKHQGTNLVDFSVLWDMLQPIIKAFQKSKTWANHKEISQQGSRYVAIKIKAVWEMVAIKMPSLPPPVEAV